jgi:hypothetical protein
MIRTTKPHLVAYNGYCNKCSIVDPLLKRPIRDYVEGCFDLGIWANLVCWPLRSSQQLTTGTSVISLGGLGSYPMTLNGSPLPTVGANGVGLVVGNGHFLTTSSAPTLGSSLTAMVVHANAAPTDASRGLQFFKDTINLGGLWSPFSGQGYWDCINQTTARINANMSVTADVFFSHIGQGSAAGLAQYKDATLINQSATAADFSQQPIRIDIGRNLSAASYTGTVSMVLIANSTSVTPVQLHDLYKGTLGIGLNLP